jgi:hypothetical protein
VEVDRATLLAPPNYHTGYLHATISAACCEICGKVDARTLVAGSSHGAAGGVCVLYVREPSSPNPCTQSYPADTAATAHSHSREPVVGQWQCCPGGGSTPPFPVQWQQTFCCSCCLCRSEPRDEVLQPIAAGKNSHLQTKHSTSNKALPCLTPTSALTLPAAATKACPAGQHCAMPCHGRNHSVLYMRHWYTTVAYYYTSSQSSALPPPPAAASLPEAPTPPPAAAAAAAASDADETLPGCCTVMSGAPPAVAASCCSRLSRSSSSPAHRNTHAGFLCSS